MTKRQARGGLSLVISAYDQNALKVALQVKEKHGGKVTALCLGSSEAQAAVRTAVETFGRIDILFNNLGTNVRKPVVDMPAEDWHTILETNVKGVFLVARTVARQMMAQGSSHIVNMSSSPSIIPERDKVVFASSKGAIMQFTKGLALELGPHGITVNAIAPGYMMTDLVKAYLEADAGRYKRILSRIPLARIGQPEEIGPALVLLASDAARYTTGGRHNPYRRRLDGQLGPGRPR